MEGERQLRNSCMYGNMVVVMDGVRRLQRCCDGLARENYSGGAAACVAWREQLHVDTGGQKQLQNSCTYGGGGDGRA